MRSTGKSRTVTDQLTPVTPDEFVEFVIDPQRRSDPYPFYARLREVAPVHVSAIGVHLVSRYEDVALVLRDPRFSTSEHHVASYEGPPAVITPFGRMFDNMLLFKDDPHHKRLRIWSRRRSLGRWWKVCVRGSNASSMA